jgi:hypothetical protein
LGVWDLGFEVQGLACEVHYGLRLRASNIGFEVYQFRVQEYDLGFGGLGFEGLAFGI